MNLILGILSGQNVQFGLVAVRNKVLYLVPSYILFILHAYIELSLLYFIAALSVMSRSM